MNIQEAMNPSIDDAIKYYRSIIFPQDMSAHTLRAIAINELTIKALLEKAARAAPENKALTLFDKITESPEKLAKFLGAIDIGKIELDECFCKSDCGDDSGCPHELQCIINWLDKPEGSKKS